MRKQIVHVLDRLTDNQVEQVYCFAIGKAIGTRALNELRDPESDLMLAHSIRSLISWGLVDPFSYRRTRLGERVCRFSA